MQIQEDIRKRPDLFHFGPSVTAHQLNAWLQQRNLVVPEDLKRMWCELGGGEMFESETILSPFGEKDLADDVDSVNEFHWNQGMPSDYLIFHTGIGGLTVVKLREGKYASVDENKYLIERNFDSIAEWYCETIRKEYSLRYRLN